MPEASETHDRPGLTEAEVRHVAKLARLALSDDEVAHFAEQLDAVLGYVAQMSEVDVEGVEPMPHALDQVNVLRDDVPAEPLDVEAALANAPQREDAFFGVPKVLGDGGGA